MDMHVAGVDFLEGRLIRSPDHCAPLDAESAPIKEELVHPRHGLLTLGSQPTARKGP